MREFVYVRDDGLGYCLNEFSVFCGFEVIVFVFIVYFLLVG